MIYDPPPTPSPHPHLLIKPQDHLDTGWLVTVALAFSSEGVIPSYTSEVLHTWKPPSFVILPFAFCSTPCPSPPFPNTPSVLSFSLSLIPHFRSHFFLKAFLDPPPPTPQGITQLPVWTHNTPSALSQSSLQTVL